MCRHYARNFGFIIAFGAVCRLGYLALIYMLTIVNGGQEPAEPVAGDTLPDSTVTASLKGESTEEVNAWSHGSSDPAEANGTEGRNHGKTVFSFSDIGYTITPKSMIGTATGPPKSVLAGVTATVTSGEVLAIVGPSGAGKTVLTNTLTFSKGPGVPTGKIVLDGTAMTRKLFVDRCIYVPRGDNLWPTLTARQHLHFAFQSYRPDLSADARSSAIDDLLGATGMASAQHTKAGGLLLQGLSGGQCRRPSLEIALVKEPPAYPPTCPPARLPARLPTHC